VNFVDPDGLEGWMFHPKDHGGPHFQKGTNRYDSKTLRPLEHKGKTPPELGKKQIKRLMKTGVWTKALSQGLANPNILPNLPLLFLLPGQEEMLQNFKDSYPLDTPRDPCGNVID